MSPTAGTGFQSLGQRIARVARQQRHRPAIVGHDDVVHSYDDVLVGLARFTAALAELGVQPGQLVGLECPYHLHHVYLRLGCQALGAITVSFSAPEQESAGALTRSCDLFICTDPSHVTRATRTYAITQDWLRAVAARPVGDDDLARLETPCPPDRIVRLLRTSGTTGESKAIALSAAAELDRWQVYRRPPFADDHRARALPFPAGLEEGSGAACDGLAAGSLTVFTVEDRIFTAIDRFQVTHCRMLVAHAERLLDRVPPSWVKPPRLLITIHGGQVGPKLRAALLARIATSVESYYAAREVGLVAVMDEDGSGRVMPDVEVMIRDADGNPLADGQEGRISVRSPRRASFYLDNPAATRAAFRDDWFDSNDVGRRLAPDRLLLAGRADDMLNIGGAKVPAGYVEGQMRDIPGVAEAALVSVRNALGMEQLAAMLEVPPGIPVDPILAEAGRLAARYADCKVVTVHRLPRTETGKVRKFLVQRWFRRHLGLPDE